MHHGINDHSDDSRFGTLGHIGTLPVTLYGILVVLGFILAVIIAAIKLKKFYKVSYDPFLTFAVIAFPFGILSASIWSYIIGNSSSWYSGFTGTGGLAIQGGVFMGTVFGLFWFPIILRKPKYWTNVPFGKSDQALVLKRTSTWIYFDAIIPVVLLGQAIGRWGNFFNYEVFGEQIGTMNYTQAMEAIKSGNGASVPLDWLRHAMPAVWQNMWININNTFNTGTLANPSASWANSAYMHQPLFLYESFFNIIFFTIFYGIANFIPKYKVGLIGGFSIVYTGAFRSVTEPMRWQDPNSVGNDGNKFQFHQSIVLSGVIIAIGLFIIVVALFLGYKKIRHVQWYEYYFDNMKFWLYNQMWFRKLALNYGQFQDNYLHTRLLNKINYDLERFSRKKAIIFVDYIVGNQKTKYYGQQYIKFFVIFQNKISNWFWKLMGLMGSSAAAKKQVKTTDPEKINGYWIDA